MIPHTTAWKQMRDAPFENAQLCRYDMAGDQTRNAKTGELSYDYTSTTVQVLKSATATSDGNRRVSSFRIRAGALSRPPRVSDRIYFNAEYWYVLDWRADQLGVTYTLEAERR